MGQKCVMCHKNIPVIYTTRFENGKTINEGICLSCAYKNRIGGLDEMFTKSGVNDSNVDQITEHLNQVMEQMQGTSPQNLLAAMFGGEVPENIASILGGVEGQNAEDEEEDEYIDIYKSNDSDSNDEEYEDGFESSLQLFTNSPMHGGEGDRSALAEGSEAEEEVKWPLILPKKQDDHQRDSKRAGARPRRKKRKFLDQFGRNLNDRALNGELDPLIGRQKELDRVIQILNRRSKNNPVLLGEPGVGKTAIAEGLASRIVAGEVPQKLLDMEVYLLDMTAMVAGTQFRGQFENRMKGLVDEATKEANIILVIDELHNIMGAGDAEGAMNAANILKPALAKGEIRVLGSTTLDEYRRFVEKDSALERRFQKVTVDPPTAEETFEILKGLRPHFEKHHHVTYSDDVLQACVRLSERYISERFLPDKAIDLMDEAGSKANLKDEDLIVYSKLKKDQQLTASQLERLSTEAQPDDKDPSALEAFYARQAELKSHKLKTDKELNQLEERIAPTPITEDDIADVVAMWTNIPVKSLTETEQKKLLHMEERLHERLIGQEKAVSAVSRALRRTRAGLRSRKKPSSFIFVGPTGVGKTELVKALAQVMFDSEEALIRLDMSEYMEPHTVSKLIGSPPGYVGYDDGGQLTEKIRRKPYSVLLLDEIEKAHADVFNMLLQILDEGRLTDGHGRLVDFSNTVIIMTSNVGTTKSGGYGFGSQQDTAAEERILTKLREFFRPEFLNRVDEVVVFHTLTQPEIRRIVELMLKDVNDALKQSCNVEIAVSDEAKDYLAKEGYSDEYGARPLRRTITRKLEDPLAELKLAGKLDGAFGVAVTVENGELKLEAH